ncbi:nuclease P1 [Sodiomyces alkalinus F11]|uniref:Nuclease P1 n=1 Tax=Sodiomyces alkalinus (strain CBS 110278 / VKM F-3762 / F11) TaxID=1314773 RepID=A0A3N2Q979_SODAK|nr:nuclease P1 [Sodiomyces alkalinus F11]ROT43185.1 nuclease P1 [Sodiomyces alkalinus F11]
MWEEKPDVDEAKPIVHQQIGYAADKLLSDPAKAIIAEILEPEADGSLGRIGAWADAHRGTPEGSHTAPWHFINPGDQPPSFCNVYFHRDCTSDGCIVSAIGNETQILKSCIRDVKEGRLESGANATCANAAKFITHFIMDIAQPMHVTGQARGGNDIPVLFGGVQTNLHSIWDGRIVYTLAGHEPGTGFGNETIDPFFEAMVHKIQEDSYFVPTKSWLSCADPSTALDCPLEWARDANQWNCDYAFSQTVGNGTDLLYSGYAAGAWHIAEVQMAKAVLRIATWFNRLADCQLKERDVIINLVPSWSGGPNGGA